MRKTSFFSITAFVAVFALAALVFALPNNPPQMSAQFVQLPEIQKQNISVSDFSQTQTTVKQSSAFNDTHTTIPTIDISMDNRVTGKYSPPITRKRLIDKNIYVGLDRQRPEKPPNRG